MRRFAGLETVVALAVCATSVSTRTARADEAPAKAAMVHLLDAGWSTALPARAAADKAYEEVVQLAAGDPRGEYAYVLVLLQQRRYEDAGKQLDQLIDREDSDLRAWRARIWLSALTKNYQAAMAAAERVAPRLAGDAEPDDSVRRDFAAFLGRIYGYFGGPVADKVKAEERKRSEKAIVAKLPNELQAVFEEGRNGVVDQFMRLTHAKEDSREQAKAQAEENKQKTLEDLDQQRTRVDERKDQLKDQVARAEADLRGEIDDLAARDRPLEAQANQLQIQGARVEADLATLTNQFAALELDWRRERDPDRRAFLRAQMDRLTFSINRVQADLASLQRQANAIASQRANLSAQANAAKAKYGGELNKADREAGNLDKQLKRADAMERNVSKPVSGTTSKVTAIGAQAAARTTYEPFPLEQEKRRLLDLLK